MWLLPNHCQSNITFMFNETSEAERIANHEMLPPSFPFSLSLAPLSPLPSFLPSFSLSPLLCLPPLRSRARQRGDVRDTRNPLTQRRKISPSIPQRSSHPELLQQCRENLTSNINNNNHHQQPATTTTAVGSRIFRCVFASL